jgi:hypothetical protein
LYSPWRRLSGECADRGGRGWRAWRRERVVFTLEAPEWRVCGSRWQGLEGVAEGVATAPAALKLVDQHHLRAPMIRAMAAVLAGQLTMRQATDSLMSLPATSGSYPPPYKARPRLHARNPFNLHLFYSAQCLMVRRWRLIGHFPYPIQPASFFRTRSSPSLCPQGCVCARVSELAFWLKNNCRFIMTSYPSASDVWGLALRVGADLVVGDTL